MIPIEYPKDEKHLRMFEEKYIKALTKNTRKKIDEHLIGFLTEDDKQLTYEKLVVLKFNELAKLAKELQSYSKTRDQVKTEKDGTQTTTNDFLDLFKYNSNQSLIADFFMNELPELKCCHYCGIDFINAFNDISDYYSPEDFVNRAYKYELQLVDRIDENIANQIILQREKEKITVLGKLKLSKEIIQNLRSFDYKKNYNHFTLDHIFPQSEYNFYSLCLYNFVPSCSSCNSKFKNKTELKKELLRISPTSSTYSLPDQFEFRILKTGDVSKIKNVNDFILEPFIISIHRDSTEEYLKMFKIPGRYNFHKNYALKLIQLKIRYPESKIEELSNRTGISTFELRKRIFGEELFDLSIVNEPLLKFKRDVAKSIGIRLAK